MDKWWRNKKVKLAENEIKEETSAILKVIWLIEVENRKADN